MSMVINGYCNNTVRYGQDEKNSSITNNSIGEIVTGQVVTENDEKKIKINDKVYSVSNDSLSEYKNGDSVYFKVESNANNRLSLKKIADNLGKSNISSIISSQIASNSQQLVNEFQSNVIGVNEGDDSTRDMSKLLEKISDADIKKLEGMNIDVLNSDVSFLLGMLSSIGVSEDSQSNQELVEYKHMVDVVNNSGMSQGKAYYLLSNEMDFSVENLYKATYSYNKNYTSEGVSKQEWDELEPQVESRLNQLSIDNNETNINAAKWLINNKLPITKENISGYNELMKIADNGIDYSIVEKNERNNLENQKDIKTTNVCYLNTEIKVKQLIEDVSNIKNSDVNDVVDSGQKVNLENLILNSNKSKNHANRYEQDSKNAESKAGESNQNAYINDDDSNSENEIKYVTAMRQLAEIQLKMTVEAAKMLLDNEIDVKTEDLQSVIDQLREIENNYYSNVLNRNDVNISDNNLENISNTDFMINQLKNMPCYAIATVITDGEENTISNLHKEGLRLENLLQDANEQYETMMTRPRRDMGDSINKAFQNIDSILESMDVSVTQANERAVKILSFNHMEISEKNIDKIKLADSQVNNVLENMTPDVVANMIKEGINPLEISIEELNAKINEMKDSMESITNDKYSEYLYKLDKSDAISEDERKSYIGIFRLLNKISKTDGKDIGMLVDSNQELSLNNLLKANRIIDSNGVNVDINDDFGVLDQLKQNGEQIDTQIKTAFNRQLSNKLTDILTPDIINSIATTTDVNELTMEQLYEQAVNEKHQLEKENREYIKSQFDNVELDNRNEAISLLNRLDMPVSINNLVATQYMLSKNQNFFRKIRSLDGLSNESLENIEKKIDSIEESLVDSQSLSDAYDDLTKAVVKSSEDILEKENLSYQDIVAMKNFNIGLKVMSSMTKTESFKVPIRINDEISIMDVTINFSGDSSSTIEANVETTQLGNVSGKFKVDGKSINGDIFSDTYYGQNIIKDNVSEFISTINEKGYSTSGETDKDTKDVKASTKELYGISKDFVKFIRKMASNN